MFYNLSNYDAHFVIKYIALGFNGAINLLSINKERYTSFIKNVQKAQTINFKFIGSFRFLPESLAKLASYCDKLNLIEKEFPNNYNLLTRKGVFPYEYIDRFDRLDEKCLPDKTKFYSQLNDSHITDSDYEHAQYVWSTFNIKTIGEYSDLYLKTVIFFWLKSSRLSEAILCIAINLTRLIILQLQG